MYGECSSRIRRVIDILSSQRERKGDGNEEEENIDVAALGKDGKINLICSLPAQGKTNVTAAGGLCSS